ncbi:MAG TPA: TPM domain-containing protein [Bryobacteraceae bacterium]|nr:TPM domain-containing protein [Bryobacteraceae bacterium]
MKKWRRVGLALVVCAAAGWAVDWTAYKPQGYVSDFANVIDPASRSQLENYCAAVERATHAQVALVTVPSLEGEPIEDVAYALARAWGVGRKGQNDGILLLLAIQDRRSRLEVGSGLESVLPGSLGGDILTEMRPALRKQQYGEAMMAAAETIGHTVAKARGVKIETKLPRKTRPETGDWLPWPVLVGGGLLVIWLLFSGAPRGYGGWGGGGFLPWLILGNMMGRSTWGSRSSGGFGGYDSGDSFGGFGGGDFGGGGASGDW